MLTLNQAHLAQSVQVMGDQAERESQAFRDLAIALHPFHQHVENAQTRGVPQCSQESRQIGLVHALVLRSWLDLG